MALHIPMNKMLPSGAALAWAATCKNISNNIKVEQNNLKGIGENGGAAVKAAVDAGYNQKEQIENEANMMYSQGAAGVAGAAIGLAIEGYFLMKSFNLDAEANKEVGDDEFTRLGAKPTVSTGAAEEEPTGTTSGDKPTIAKLKPEAELTTTPASAKGTLTEVRTATAKADDVAAAQGSTDLTKVRVNEQNQTTTAATDDGQQVREDATSANNKSAETLRGQANSFRQTGSALSQLFNGLFTSLGTLIGASYKMAEASYQQAATALQGLSQMFSSVLQIKQDGLSAAEASVSGSVQLLSTASQASAAGYRG